MTEIIPAILEKSFSAVTNRLQSVVGLVSAVQIDVCDGVFVPSVSWPYVAPLVTSESKYYDEFFKQVVGGKGEVDMPMWEDFGFELDLMIRDVKGLLPDLLTIGPSRIVFHAESFADVYSDMHDIAKTVPPIVEVGLAINANTNPEVVYKLIDEKIISFVQCMGIEKIGYQGQPTDERVYTHLKTLREKYPNLPLSVDGSVSLSDAKQLVSAGATRLVVGSAIFSSEDIDMRIAEFENLIQ